MQKRGQVTAFVILGIIILVIAVSIAYVQKLVQNRQLESEKEVVLSLEVQKIKNSVDDCIEKTSYNALYEIGQSGGYYILPNNSIDIGVPIYFDRGKVNIPKLFEIEYQLSLFIEDNLERCSNFTKFSQFEITPWKINTIAIIKPEKVEFNVKYPLSIKQEEIIYQLDESKNIKIPVSFGLMYNTAKQLVNLQRKNPRELCLTCFVKIAQANKIGIDLFDYDEEIILFDIFEEKQVNNKTYEFVFANKYDVK